MAVQWSHDEPVSFADFDAERDQSFRQASKMRRLEDRVLELEAQLRSVLHILEAHGLNGRDERTN